MAWTRTRIRWPWSVSRDGWVTWFSSRMEDIESLSLVNVKYFCTAVINPHTHAYTQEHWLHPRLLRPTAGDWALYGNRGIDKIGIQENVCVDQFSWGGGSRLDLHPRQFSENDRPLIILIYLNKKTINYKDFCFIGVLWLGSWKEQSGVIACALSL